MRAAGLRWNSRAVSAGDCQPGAAGIKCRRFRRSFKGAVSVRRIVWLGCGLLAVLLLAAALARQYFLLGEHERCRDVIAEVMSELDAGGKAYFDGVFANLCPGVHEPV